MRLIIATLLVFSLSTYVFATAPFENPIVTLEKVGEKKYQLKYMSIPVGKVTVSIKDDNNRVIYKDVISAEKLFYKNYDLNNLELGSYHLEVMNTVSGKLKDFEIDLLAAKKEETSFTRIKRIDRQNLGLIVKNLNGEEKTIRIFDQGNLIFETSFAEEIYGKKFKFENVKSLDKITIEVSDKDGSSKYRSAL